MPVHHLNLLQANLNHCARAQDLLMQSMAQWSIDAAVLAEPYLVPPLPNWAGDTNDDVAVVVPTSGDTSLTPKERGPGYVATIWGETVLIGTYFSPNRTLAQFEQFLERLERAVRRAAPAQVLLMGDLNAKSDAWGSPVTDARGAALADWVATVGLEILNRGHANTCVRHQGGLSWT